MKLICFDLDQTLIAQSSWTRLGLGLGVTIEEDARLLDEYKKGNIDYDEWNKILLEKYIKHENATREGITKILSKYELVIGARDIVDFLKKKGYKIALISGSLDILVNIVAKDLGIEYAKAHNSFVFDEDGKLVNINTVGDDVKAKADYLESFCDMLGIKMSECVCVGDGFNDVEMFRRTGHGITFRGSKIEKEAWKIIDSLLDIKTLFL